MTFQQDTFRPLTDAPVGQAQKTQDAQMAIQFARSYTGQVNTTLTPVATRAIQIVIDRILDELQPHG